MTPRSRAAAAVTVVRMGCDAEKGQVALFQVAILSLQQLIRYFIIFSHYLLAKTNILVATLVALVALVACGMWEPLHYKMLTSTSI